ncbi:unnamed protein product [Protopolystoma xenopodis]|uniref:ATPase AAA-type core domain-containing protein n=1 Tax=Protopolystoma xenopodis TaxID=117903 RepID=A0A448WMQ8_9PLAT|nr:unnamed protein product [Protopolystoma xenopodis]
MRDRLIARGNLADIEPMEIDTSIGFDDVGGHAEQIRALKETVILPLIYPEVFARFKIEPPRGVLFHGPPGNF